MNLYLPVELFKAMVKGASPNMARVQVYNDTNPDERFDGIQYRGDDGILYKVFPDTVKDKLEAK